MNDEFFHGFMTGVASVGLSLTFFAISYRLLFHPSKPKDAEPPYDPTKL